MSDEAEKKTNENPDHMATVEKKVVDGVQVKSYTLNEGHESLFHVPTEVEIEQKVEEYNRKLQEEADKAHYERVAQLKKQMEETYAREAAEDAAADAAAKSGGEPVSGDHAALDNQRGFAEKAVRGETDDVAKDAAEISRILAGSPELHGSASGPVVDSSTAGTQGAGTGASGSEGSEGAGGSGDSGSLFDQEYHGLDPETIGETIAAIKKEDFIFCLGDSITFGYEVEGKYSWVGRLRMGDGLNLINMGINGDTTAGMLERFRQHVVANKPKAVLIMGGGNDIMGLTPLDYVTTNITMMCQIALENFIVPMIGIEPEPDHKNVPKEWKTMLDYDQAKENLATYKEWLIMFAKANNLPLFDFDTGMKDRLRAGYGRYFMDGVHPTPGGYSIMADIARDKFIELGILEKPDTDAEDAPMAGGQNIRKPAPASGGQATRKPTPASVARDTQTKQKKPDRFAKFDL